MGEHKSCSKEMAQPKAREIDIKEGESISIVINQNRKIIGQMGRFLQSFEETWESQL